MCSVNGEMYFSMCSISCAGILNTVKLKWIILFQFDGKSKDSLFLMPERAMPLLYYYQHDHL